jgi:hypothetical protein
MKEVRVRTEAVSGSVRHLIPQEEAEIYEPILTESPTPDQINAATRRLHEVEKDRANSKAVIFGEGAAAQLARATLVAARGTLGHASTALKHPTGIQESRKAAEDFLVATRQDAVAALVAEKIKPPVCPIGSFSAPDSEWLQDLLEEVERAKNTILSRENEALSTEG